MTELRRIIPSDYNQEVILGNIEGVQGVVISSENPSAKAGVTENVWHQGGTLKYLSADTDLYISSSSALDTTQTILQRGLASTLTEVVGFATLNGQNQVLLNSQFFRMYQSFNLGPIATVGDIYIAELDTLTGGVPDDPSKIQNKIPIGRNLSNNGTFAIRAGSIGYILQVEGSVEKAKNASIGVSAIEPSTGLKYEVMPSRVFQGEFSYFAKSGLAAISEGAVIEMTVTSQDIDTYVTVNMTVNLVETDA